MRISLRSIFLLSVLVLSSFVARPAAAQEPPTPRTIYAEIIGGLNEGYFKCSVKTVLQLLQLAASTPCPQKLVLLQMAQTCLCGLSREINELTGQPYQTLGVGIYDLANFAHTVPAQVFGRRLCELLSAAIATACPPPG